MSDNYVTFFSVSNVVFVHDDEVKLYLEFSSQRCSVQFRS